MRRPSPATVLAGLALFVALGGTAIATGLIDGRQIKPGTIALSRLKPGAVSSLKGRRGPKGRPGADGVVHPLIAETYDVEFTNANMTVALVTLNVPDGEYMVTAKTNLVAGSSSNSFHCYLQTGYEEPDQASWDPTGIGARNSLSLVGITQFETSTFTLSCNPGGGTGSAKAAKIIAVPIQH